jgi:hypothetical protein
MALVSDDGFATLRCADGKMLKHIKARFDIAISSAAGIMADGHGALSFFSWQGDVLSKITGRNFDKVWCVLALSPDGSHMLCHGPSGICLRDTKTGEALEAEVSSRDEARRLSARYALGWENLPDLRICPDCRSRAKVKHRHEARFDAVEGGRIRAMAYGGETLWIAAGNNIFQMVAGKPAVHASPGPVNRFFVDGERLICVLRGGLVEVSALNPACRSATGSSASVASD